MWDDLPVVPAEEYQAMLRLRQLQNAANSLSTAAATIRGSIWWNGKPEIDDDGDDGSAPVREPRRPRSGPPSLGMEKAPDDIEGLVRVS